jgi:hypothetical protein
MTKGTDAPGKSLQEGSPMYKKADNTPDGRGGMPKEGTEMPSTRGGSGKLSGALHSDFKAGVLSDGKGSSVGEMAGPLRGNPGGAIDYMIGSSTPSGVFQPSSSAYDPARSGIGAKANLGRRRNIAPRTVAPPKLGFYR